MNDEGLKFHLDYFDGPLDLLLHLIKDSKIDVETVFLSAVTEQFLDYMSEIETVPLETQSEFLSVASTLLEIKSKALLPRYDAIDTNTDDEAEQLIRRLEEYKLFKEASAELKNIEDINKLYRPKDPKAFVNKVVFKESDVDSLMKVFTKLMMMNIDEQRREGMVEKVIPKDDITVSIATNHIREHLKERGKTTLFAMFDGNITRIKLVMTFLAMLEMIKNQEIKATQIKEFSDIEIELIDKGTNEL